MRADETPRAVLASLALATFICYLNAFAGDFQFDDYNVIVDNPHVHTWEAWLAGLGHGVRPLLKLSYTLDWTLGLGVTGFHLTNLIIHLGNAYLVYRLSGEFVRHQVQHERLGNVPLFAALLFIAHPVHTEAVTYICGRSASLMTLLYLGALLAYTAGRARHNKIFLYLVTPLLFVLALGVKEIAVTFPLALLVWERFCIGNREPAFKQQWPSWAILLIAVLYFLLNDSYIAHMEHSAELNSFTGSIATQLTSFAYLLRQWALPLWLNIDPDLPLLHDLSDAILPSLLFIAVCVLTLHFRRSRPWISFALSWTVIHLLVLYLFLPRIDIANDRQLYLASWPLLLALTVELALLVNVARFRRIAATLLVALTALTFARNRDYASEIALWEDTASKSPNKARVHNNLGYAYLLAHRHEDARREFTLALRLSPDNIKARSNLERVEVEHPEN